VIQVVVDDLVSTGVDALVRPATTALEPASSAGRTLEAGAGLSFNSQFARTSDQAVGSAVVTGGGALSAPFVIHAIIRSSEEPATEAGVRQAFLSVLQRAKEWQFARIATPPLETEPGAMVMETTAGIMSNLIIQHLKDSAFPSDVTIVVGSETDRATFATFLERALA
jgi:O-acetyl-ADP-ribose deacetylase